MHGFSSKAAIEDVRAQNLICILDVDIQGVRRIKETDLNPIYISIQPPSMEILVTVQLNAILYNDLKHLTSGWNRVPWVFLSSSSEMF